MRRGAGLAASPVSTRGGGHKIAEVENIQFGATCGVCGAERVDAQIGIEDSAAEYVEALVEVFREVRRVLRSDGTLWLNIGDSYGGGKQLLGIPWRVAHALQEDGWIVRSEIIWAKPNAMPESVTDRPTKAHEQVFLLAKATQYFFDAHAIREEASKGYGGSEFHKGASAEAREHFGRPISTKERDEPEGKNKRDVWEIATVPYKEAHFATFPPKLVEPCVKAGTPEAGSCEVCGAPRKRIVARLRTFDGEETVEGGWDQDEAGRIGAAGVGHWRYATSMSTLGWRPTCSCGAPEGVQPDDLDLIESPTGEGPLHDPSLEVGRAGYARPRNAGAGRRTITRFQQRGYARQLRALPDYTAAELREQDGITDDAWAHYIRLDASGGRPLPPGLLERYVREGILQPVEPPDWEPPPASPATVLDPFSGAGTTGLVALRLGRSFVGVELNPDYAELARQRLRDDAPLMNVPAEVAEDAGAPA